VSVENAGGVAQAAWILVVVFVVIQVAEYQRDSRFLKFLENYLAAEKVKSRE